MAETEPVAWCDGNRLEQVLVNLINNALDAMAGAPTPCVHVRCELPMARCMQAKPWGQGCLKRRLPICSSRSSPPRARRWPGPGPGLVGRYRARIGRHAGGANHPRRWRSLPPHPACGTAGPPTTIMTDDLMLIVEDDPDIVLGCEQALQLEGIAIRKRPSAEKARGWGVIFGVVVSDIRLPQMDGMAFLQKSCAPDPELPVVLITGHGDISTAVQAMKDGAITTSSRSPSRQSSW